MKTRRILMFGALTALLCATAPSSALAHHPAYYSYGPHVHVGVGIAFGSPYYAYPYYGYPGYPYVYAPPYYYPGVYPGYAYPVYVYPGYGHPAYVAGPAVAPVGFADLDVEPEEAKVYVKGAIVGTADDYDGFPQYLPLEPGNRTVVLKQPGYKDLVLTLHITPGAVVRVRQDMQPLSGAAHHKR